MRKLLVVLVFTMCVGSSYAQTAKWKQTNGPYGNGVAAAAGLLASDGKTLFASVDNGLFATTDDGDKWTEVNNYFPESMALRDTVWFETLEGSDICSLLKSTDGGYQWDTCGYLADGVIIVGNKQGLLIGGGWSPGGMYRSTDDGADWMEVDSIALSHYWISVYKIALSDDLAAAIIDSENSEQLIVSNDLGDTWQRGNIADSSIYTIAVVGDAIFTGTDSGIYRSSDLGMTWVRVTTFPSVSMIVSNENIILAASSEGCIIISTNSGQDWNTFNDSLPSLDISAIAIGSGEVFATLTSGGIYYSKLSAISGVNSLPAIFDKANFLSIQIHSQYQQLFATP